MKMEHTASSPPAFFSSRLRRWTGIVSQIAGAQLLVLAANALAGFAVVRLLEKNEYSWYTIVMALSALMSAVGDSGVTSGLLSEGGKTWANKREFSSLTLCALRLRRIFFFTVCSLAGPFTLWVLLRNGATAAPSASMILLVLVAGYLGAEAAVLGVGLKLRSSIGTLQRHDLLGAGVRLSLSLVMLVAFRASLSLVVVLVISQYLQLRYLRLKAHPCLDLAVEPQAEHRQSLLQISRSLWFPTLFYAVQGQIGAYLLGIFGSDTTVADIGALGRFGVLFSIVLAVLANAAGPAFARCGDKSSLLRQAALTLLGVGGFCGVMCATAWLMPAVFLWLLGAKYTELGGELLLYMVFQSMWVLGMLTWTLISARGWVRHTWVAPVGTLVLQTWLFSALDVSTVSGNLWLMIWSQTPGLLMSTLLAFHGFRTWGKSSVLPVS